MPYSIKGEQRNTGRTHFRKGFTPWNKNRIGIYSEETRGKIGEATRNRLLENHPFKGKHHTEETRQKIRETLLKLHAGEIKHSGIEYQNNIWRELRKLVYRRDGWKCQECGKRSTGKRELHAHHIDYDTTNNDLANLITLCPSCHGKTIFRKFDWIGYYQKKVNSCNFL